DEPGIATDIAIHSYQLPLGFAEETLAEAAAFGEDVDPESISGRLDLRELPLLTIDGADARDLDDAIFAGRRGEGFRLLVAISDVAEDVQPGGSLDDEAGARGTRGGARDRLRRPT